MLLVVSALSEESSIRREGSRLWDQCRKAVLTWFFPCTRALYMALGEVLSMSILSSPGKAIIMPDLEAKLGGVCPVI